MGRIDDILAGKNSVGITGHIRPDGDCAGSCLGLYNYIRVNYPEIFVKLYLEPLPQKFLFLPGAESVDSSYGDESDFDIFIVLDTSDHERMGKSVKYFAGASATLAVDHHISNELFAEENILIPDASSTAEVLYGLLDPDRLNKDMATCLYTGIIFDSGVFKYSNTSQKTMNIAGKLISYGIDFTKIIDNSFYASTYKQNRIMGRALLDSKLVFGDICIYSLVTRDIMDQYGVNSSDLDGIVEQLRNTTGVECALFVYELEDGTFKASLRSSEYLDVNKVAQQFGGGGHVRAAGCSLKGPADFAIRKILGVIAGELSYEWNSERI
ncbi:DHH family phosphoesterase [Parasporobacterium paucivorans]|uniref:Phosphoesterase RecJ domain-containing protein n=1 Tax=Parasporobacterium paucivorans DSM 15970 TaxID=1122934 RepID=A0A1M6EUG7_9FIRM|nr:bifunctional oligoribonuclease/PAP phosphatase NrnA [Parasporobacterium paucivorans]SHI89019.1 phosphoesterase RecJ domain-containing protein [Parasporobacterium paucivorans DSM 15970]